MPMHRFQSQTVVQELEMLGAQADAFEMGEQFFSGESPTEAPCCLRCAVKDAPTFGPMEVLGTGNYERDLFKPKVPGTTRTNRCCCGDAELCGGSVGCSITTCKGTKCSTVKYPPSSCNFIRNFLGGGPDELGPQLGS